MISNPPGSRAPVSPAVPIDDRHGVESARIIIVDDDPALRDLLVAYLVEHGLRAEAVDGGAALRLRLDRCPCDLIVLDMMMPGENGLSVLRTLPQGGDAPGVIIFSALASEVDRVVALELGADDYIIKPSSPREILARIRSVLRRRAVGQGAGPATIDTPRPTAVESYAFAGWTLECRARVLRAPDGTVVRLTDGEFHLLDAFLSQPNKTHSREHMMAQAGKGDGLMRGRTIDVAISRLRRKMQLCDPREIIRTVRGDGYAFLPDITCR